MLDPFLILPSLSLDKPHFTGHCRRLHGRFDMKRLPSAAEALEHPLFFRYTCVVLILVALAYIPASAMQLPLIRVFTHALKSRPLRQSCIQLSLARCVQYGRK